jgi:hypothetical protein
LGLYVNTNFEISGIVHTAPVFEHFSFSEA